jgi:nitronate monooxygenase
MLGARIPILQAPIGGSAPPELAAAVANAGAIGGLAVTGFTGPEAIDLIARARALTEGLFFVNLLLAFEPECFPSLLDTEVPIITFSFGDASPFIAKVKASGKKCGVQVGSLEGAKRAASNGADFLILQGIEAGGRVQATQPLANLLAQVCDADLGLPLVAAGGICTSKDIHGALASADAVMMGTRFLATQESRSHEHYKARLLKAGEDATALTVCFSDGWPNSFHRVLKNKTLEGWQAAGCSPEGLRPGEGDLVAEAKDGTQYARYDMRQPLEGVVGSVDDMPMYAGTGCANIDDIPPAGELVERLWEEVGKLGVD